MARECVEQLVDGRKALSVGIPGFFTRWRGVATVLIPALVTMGVPWWWPWTWGTTTVSNIYALAVGVGTMGVIISVGLVYLRRRTERSLAIKSFLHQLSHHLRDHLVQHLRDADHGSLLRSRGRAMYFTDMRRTCSLVAKYFKLLLGDDTVEAAVRFATEDKTGELVYRTVARSEGLNPAREERTVDLHVNEGIVRFMLEKGNHGVLVYNDIEQAAKKETFKITENELRFRDEIISMAVAPINGWSEGEHKLIGLLHVTSRRKEAFELKHTDALLFVADALASTVSGIHWAFHRVHVDPHLEEEDEEAQAPGV